MSKKELTPWTGIPKGTELTDYAGFVYLIEHISSGRQYIGRKYLWTNRKTKVRGKKRKIRVRAESDWRSYKSSSKELKALIALQGVEAFSFTILSLHKSKAETNYTEVKEMFLRDVLHAKLVNGGYRYFNACIMNRYYRGRV